MGSERLEKGSVLIIIMVNFTNFQCELTPLKKGVF